MLLALFTFLISLVPIYGILWLVTPKGALLHELLRLPPFWMHIVFSPLRDFQEERITYGEHSRQYFLLCRPPQHIEVKDPIVIYFHGGGWRFGAPEQFRPHAQQLTQMGFVVALPSYRRAPRHNYRHIREDLTQLLLKTRGVLDQNGMSEKKAIIGGMSAGGNLAALAALNREALEQAGISPGWFQGIFLFGAPLHLEKMEDGFTLHNFAGPRSQPMFRQASPYHYLDKRLSIPTLIIHGTKDGMVEFESVKEFAEKMKAANSAETRFVCLPEGTHLDVASWFFRDGQARQAFFEWLEDLNIHAF